MPIFIIVAVIIFGVAGYFFLKAFWLLLKAAYFRWIASERKLDNQLYKMERKSSEYQSFEKSIEEMINQNNGNK